MDRMLSRLGGIGLGATLMYVLDPQGGRRRRALVRDQLVHLIHELGEFADGTGRDAANRARGLWAEVRSAIDGRTPDDRTLAERVRSHLGRCVSHPWAITVAVDEGQVTLTGPVLADEVDGLLSRVRNVPGASEVVNRLEVHPEAGDFPALQGGTTRTGALSEPFQENWSPTLRLMAGTLGVGLMGNCLARRDLASVLLGTVGFGLFLRSATNSSAGAAVGRLIPAPRMDDRPAPRAVIAAGPVL